MVRKRRSEIQWVIPTDTQFISHAKYYRLHYGIHTERLGFLDGMMVIEEIHKVNVHETCSREIAWILKPKGLDVRINKIRLEGKPVGENVGGATCFVFSSVVTG